MTAKLHFGALVLLAIATVFYMISWLPGMLGFAAIGIAFEVTAWAVWLAGDRRDPPSVDFAPPVEVQTSSEPIAPPPTDRRDPNDA